MDLLFVCTANQCRSPMAAALLRAELDGRGVEGVTIRSAGLLPGGAPAAAEAISAFPGLAEHLSQTVTPGLMEAADLVLAMAREHLREAVVMTPAAFGSSFTIKELVRRGEAAGARSEGEELRAWLGRVGAGRSAADLLGSHPEDDVADPMGLDALAWQETIDELTDLTRRLADLIWG